MADGIGLVLGAQPLKKTTTRVDTKIDGKKLNIAIRIGLGVAPPPKAASLFRKKLKTCKDSPGTRNLTPAVPCWLLIELLSS
jgi:hypothetical protein